MTATGVVLFVCQHGAAKSVVAAACFDRLAAASGLAVRALARGTEPEPAVSPAAATGLRAAGIDLSGFRPQLVSREELATAWRVVSFGPDLEHLLDDPGRLEYWTDVPAVGHSFDAARDAILAHLPELLERALHAP